METQANYKAKQETFNTIYVECFAPIWDHYLIMDDLVYRPKILIGEERQKRIAELKNIAFYDRADINNQSIDFEYELTDTENNIVKNISENRILFNTYFRISADTKLSHELLHQLTLIYSRMWFYMINKFDLNVLILHEMPHLPYTFIGYLIFQHLKLKIIFAATMPFYDRSYFVSSLENYRLFKEDTKKYLSDSINNDENIFYASKLQSEHELIKGNKKKGRFTFGHVFLIYLRNFLFPRITKRLRFYVIRKDQFFDQEDRHHYLLILVRLILKYFRKIYYYKIMSKMEETKKINIFFALHYEPELALWPLAGENFNQFEILIELSKKLGEKGTIYIKEHPWMFNFSKVRSIIRQKSFYKILNSQNNIKFLDFRTNTHSFLDKIDIIATLTGTIGWEVFFKKKPVLYYGFPWYAGLPGAKKYAPDMDLEEFILKCKDEYDRVDYKKIYQSMKNSVWEVSTKMYSSSENELRQKAIILKSAIEAFEHQKDCSS